MKRAICLETIWRQMGDFEGETDSRLRFGGDFFGASQEQGLNHYQNESKEIGENEVCGQGWIQDEA
jgi:hypothetical protein